MTDFSAEPNRAAAGSSVGDLPSLLVDESLGAMLSGLLGAELGVSRDGDGTLCLDVPMEHWLSAAVQIRERAALDFIDWLSAVDQSDGDPAGLDVVLHVVDSSSAGAAVAGRPRRLRRLLLRTRVPDSVGRLPSLTSVWPGAAWHERETFEMFGLVFEDFGDANELPLRPLLLPEGFEGTPLRKSFVLAARASKPWPGAKEPGESDSPGTSTRRKNLPPGVPEPGTWPRRPDTGDESAPAATTDPKGGTPRV